MHRNLLLNLLELYNPDDEKEIAYKKDIIIFIKENKNCFDRELEKGHITASSLLLNKEATHVLLMHHCKLDRWLQLGGHADGNSDVLAVAIKEAQEESGIHDIVAISDKIFDLDIHLIPKNSKEKDHLHYDIRFLLQVKRDQPFQKNSESRELRWVNKNSLPTNGESIIRMLNKITF